MRDENEQQREGWSRVQEKKGEEGRQEQIAIPGVGDVICSTCAGQESVICSTEAADFIRLNRGGPGRAALWLVTAQQRHSWE